MQNTDPAAPAPDRKHIVLTDYGMNEAQQAAAPAPDAATLLRLLDACIFEPARTTLYYELRAAVEQIVRERDALKQGPYVGIEYYHAEVQARERAEREVERLKRRLLAMGVLDEDTKPLLAAREGK